MGLRRGRRSKRGRRGFWEFILEVTSEAIDTIIWWS